MNASSRFFAVALFLAAFASISLTCSVANAQDVFGDMVGLVVHQGSIHTDGRQATAPTLYGPVQNHVRDYHQMTWDVDTPLGTPHFPYDKWNWVNWTADYGLWVTSGSKVNACIVVEGFPSASSWGSDPETAAYNYGYAFGRAFGPGVGGSNKVNAVQIGNEPGDMSDTLYKTVFRGMARGIRDADSRIIIATCNTQDSPSGDYHKNISLFADITHLVDAYATHTYPFLRGWPTWEKSYPEDTRMSYQRDVQSMQAWVQANDSTAQTWITEFGYDASSQPKTGDFMDVTDTQQAQWVVRSYLTWAEIGIDRAYEYFFNDGDAYSLHACAGVTRNYNPKPVYYAQSHMLNTLAQYRFTGAVRKDAGQLYVFGFAHKDNPSDVIWVFWSPTGSDREVTVTLNLPGQPVSASRMPLAAGSAPVVNFNTVGPTTVEILASESPTYLRIVASQSGNGAPVATAGADQDIQTDTVSLAGSVQDDGEPEPAQLVATWSKASGPGEVTFADPAAPITTATFSVAGTYVLRLTAYDGELSGSDEVTITYEAAPELVYSYVDLGGGVSGWTFRIANNDGLLMSYSVALGFQGVGGGTIQQIKSSAVHVSKEGWKEWDPEFEEWNGEGAILCDEVDPAYDMARDTWAFNPFGDNAAPGTNPITGANLTGFYNAANAFAMSCATGTGSTLGDNVNVAYVVATGNVSWTGQITRNNTVTEVQGVTEIPTTAILGDFNGDGSVTHGDYTVWADNYGRSIAEVQADHLDWFPDGSYLPGATTITQGMYTTWADHFGDTAPLTVGQTALPAVTVEPATDEAASTITTRAARIAARKQLRLNRAALRQQRRAARAR